MVMHNLIVWAFNLLMLEQLFAAFEAKRVAAWKGEGLFFIVVIGFEADSAFENLIHI
jgi:hypothetical protein